MKFENTELDGATEVYTPKNHLNPYHSAGEIFKYKNRFYFVPSGDGVYLSVSDLKQIIKKME